MIPYDRSSGFILVVVLVVLSIIALSAAVILEIGGSEISMLHHFTLRQRSQKALFDAMPIAYQAIDREHLSCEITEVSAYQLKHQRDIWWHSSRTCKIAHRQFVFERLDSSGCLSIDGDHAVDLVRLTGVESNQEVKVMLQTVFAKNSAKKIDCKSKVQHLSGGLLSWRVLA